MGRLNRRALALAACFLAAGLAGAQDGRTIRILPERPVAGTDFSMEVGLPGERAEALAPQEPSVSGPARYLGFDVAPRAGASGAVVAYRFRALAPGRVDVAGLSARAGTRSLSFGSWSLEVVAPAEPAKARRGSWLAPATAYEREAFRLAALGPRGEPVPCPGLALEGTVLRPDPSGGPALIAVAFAPGTIALPRLELSDEAGAFLVDAAEIAVRAAGGADAVGGPWRLRLSLDGKEEPRVGGLVSWDLRASGPALAGLAQPPRLAALDPSGEPVETTSRAYDGFEPDGSSYVGLRGSFLAERAGAYSLEPEPFSWLDTASGRLSSAKARPLRIVAKAPVPRPWEPTAELRAALERDSSGERPGDIGPGPGEDGGEEAWRRRAAGYARILRAERGAFALPADARLAAAADAAFGNLQRPRGVLPPVGWLASAAAACLGLALCTRLFRPRRRLLARAVAALGLALAAAAGLSLAELSRPRFVALGSTLRSAPSPLAGAVGRAEAGSTGRVLEAAGDWAWVELDAGGEAWMPAGDIETY